MYCSELTTKLHDFSVQEQLMKEKLGFHSFEVSTPPPPEDSIPATPPPTTGYFLPELCTDYTKRDGRNI